MALSRTLASIVLAAVCVPADWQSPDAAPLIAAARQALGGDAALSAVTSFSVGGTHTRMVGMNVSSSVDIKCLLPDRFVRVLARTMDAGPTGSFSVTDYDGFNRDEPIKDVVAPGAPVPVFIPGGPRPRTPDEVAAERQRFANAGKHVFAALTVPMFVTSFAGYPLDFTPAGQVQLPSGPADTLVVKGADGFTWRLFLDAGSHLPVKLSWTAKPIVTGSSTSTMTVNRRTGDTQTSPNQPSLPDNPTAGLPDVPWEMSIGDYRPEDGLTWPHRLVTTVDGRKHEELRLSRFRINPSIDPKTFNPRMFSR